MKELSIDINFESDSADFVLTVDVEYEVTGSYEAASHDSEGCEPELEFTAHYQESGNELPVWILRQVSEFIDEECWSHYQKDCNENAAEWFASKAEDDYLFG